MPATLQQHLPPGARVLRYELREVLGDGGFAITYRAWDRRMHRDVAIKEFLPKDLALREPGGADVLARSGQEDEYRLGLQRFLDEARTLAQFRHPNIVRVTDHFEANNTAYLVMDYERGRSLSQWLTEHPGPVPEATLRQWLAPLLRGLREVHNSGYLRRDINPANRKGPAAGARSSNAPARARSRRPSALRLRGARRVNRRAGAKRALASSAAWVQAQSPRPAWRVGPGRSRPWGFWRLPAC